LHGLAFGRASTLKGKLLGDFSKSRAASRRGTKPKTEEV
jgi:hypothetical protein